MYCENELFKKILYEMGIIMKEKKKYVWIFLFYYEFPYFMSNQRFKDFFKDKRK